MREKEKLIEKELRDGISYSMGEITVLELVERYIAQKKGVRPTTQNGYKTVVNLLKKDAFGTKKINSIKTSDTKLWLISLQDGGRSYSIQVEKVHILKQQKQMLAQGFCL